jgi:twitching motility protein PilT
MEIRELLQLSLDKRASDLHILPGLSPVLRIDGDLFPVKDVPPLTPDQTRQLIHSLLTAEQEQVFEKSLECDLSISLSQLANFRVNIFHQLRGVAAVFRVIPEKVPTFEELGLPSVLKSLLLLPHGLVLVAGATGSGTSSTLATMIDYINTIRACHIITIEDPIEYVYQNKKSLISQRQVYRDTHDAATALRSALRQDPDVILLGEMRDLETISLALTAAETGHLVMTTLHASSAPLAISRIVDIFPSVEKNRMRNLLSETLQAVIYQTLVKRISGGRVGAFEIMLITPAVRHLIREDKITHLAMAIQTSGDLGMCTLDQYLQELVAKRVISAAVARNAVVNQD